MIQKLKRKIKEGSPFLLKVTSILYCLFGQNKIRLSGKSNIVMYEGNYLKKCNIQINGKNNSVIFNKNGRNLIMNANIRIFGDNNKIILGDRNYFKNADLHIEDNNNIISFGNKNQIYGFTHIAAIEGKSITFGDGCLFSTDVIFRVGDSHSIISTETNKRINPSKSIHIGNRVWFGNKTTILKGVTIFDDSIVGTGAIVTSAISESNVILAGTPAKIVKENIKWDHIRI